MPDPIQIDFWHNETELKLTNIDLFILMMYADRRNKHPKCEALFFKPPKSLAFRIQAYFNQPAIPSLPDDVDLD